MEVYFEKENIYTLDSQGELLITIMSSLALEESRSISENVTWGKRKGCRMARFHCKQFLGYRKGADGLPEIVPEDGGYREGHLPHVSRREVALIHRALSVGARHSIAGRQVQLAAQHHHKHSHERKIKGDAILQKTFCTDFLTKKMKVNEGEVPQYYVEGSHSAIIEPEIFDSVQVELKHRKQQGRRNYTPHCFSGRIYCDECGQL